MSMDYFSNFHNSQPQGHSEADNQNDMLNKFADNDEEIQLLMAENQELKKHLQLQQNQYNQSIHTFAKVTSELEQLRNQLPQRIEIDLIDIERLKALGEAGNKVAKQVEESNHKLLQFQNKFLSLTTQYSESLFRLKYHSDELQPNNQFLSPPPNIPPAKSANSQDSVEQQKLQLNSFKEELEKTIQKNRNLQTQEIIQLLEILLAEIIKHITSKPSDVQNSLTYIPPQPIQHVHTSPVENAQIERDIEDTDAQSQQPSKQSIAEPPDDEPLPSWVSYYNQSPDNFSREVSHSATEVSETEESIEQRRLGNNSSVVLEKVRRTGRGNFWILIEQKEICLVPKIGVRFNNYNIATVKCLFKVVGEPQGDYKFILVKPAKVIQTKENNWQLLEPGVLQFEGE